MRRHALPNLGLVVGGVAGTLTFGVQGNALVPPQEFGPLGAIIGALFVGFPIGGLAGFLVGLIVRRLRGDSAYSLRHSVELIGLALGIVLGGIIGMTVAFESEGLVIVYGVTGLGGVAGYTLGYLTRALWKGRGQNAPKT